MCSLHLFHKKFDNRKELISKIMEQGNVISLIGLVSPALFVVTALLSWFYPRQKAVVVKKSAGLASVVALVTAAIASVAVILNGNILTRFWEYAGLGFSVRFDSVSLIMFSMIALLSIIIIRYSGNYLDGDERHGSFIGRMSATIASVQLLVISGNLFMLFIVWVATSLALHRLLIFYPDRNRAKMAAKKKFIVARIADVSLLIGIILLYTHFQSGDLQIIFNGMTNGGAAGTSTLEIAAVLMGFAALLKSAQFPTHGWLIEVMETPTPVSALLHAGLLNAGPFLMVRMAFVIQSSSAAPMLLILIGGFSALFASVVFLTQPSIKTALGYSSMAHMGFSLMLCGFGVYPAAMLHLVAHSFYKAHAFLSSGSIIENIRSGKIDLPKRKGSALRILLGIGLSLLVYFGIAWLWGVKFSNEFALLAIGLVIVMGLAKLLSTAIDSEGSFITSFRVVLLTGVVTVAFFTLEGGMHHLLLGLVPGIAAPGLITGMLILLFLVMAGVVIGAQLVGPVTRKYKFAQNLAIHFRNGWYVNAHFDRLVGALNMKN